MKKNLLLLLIIPLVLFSCKGEEEDTVAPIVTLEHPEANATFTQGDTLPIHAFITDNVWLERVEVRVNNAANDDIFFGYNVTPNNNLYEVDTFWVINVPLNTNIEVDIMAKDEAELETRVTRSFLIP